jgi:hypothetical protein
MATIHFDERYKAALLTGFEKGSDTDSLFSHDLDMEFSGVKTVHVKSIVTEPLQDYDRNKQVGTGSRYGTTSEVGNEEQTFTMQKDRAKSLSVDKGNNMEVMDKHKAGAVMKAYMEEQIIPEVDTFRLAEWAANAGIVKPLSAALTSDNVIENIIKFRNIQRNAGVKEGVSLLIPYEHLDALMLAKQWINLDSLGGKTLPKGTMGQIAGMNVIPVTTERMPAGVAFMILHKNSVIAPVKIKEFKGHVNPPGLSGDLIEFRMLYGAFVLGKKAAGVLIAVNPGLQAAAPTVAASGAVTTKESGATTYFTVDGSDPRYSATRQAYTSAPSVKAGDVVKAYSVVNGKYASDVVSATVSG